MAFLPALAKNYLLVAALACPAVKTPDVVISFNNQPPVYSNDMGRAQLGGFRSDTVFSHSADEVFTTGGITEGKVTTKFSVGYKTLTNTLSSDSCLWANDVKIEVTYAPIVHIAHEFTPGSCMYNETYRHEMRHVNTDIATVNEYIPRLKAAVAGAVGVLGQPYPFPSRDMQKQQARITGRIETAVGAVMTDFDRQRQARQQLIDTRQEYLRLSRICP